MEMLYRPFYHYMKTKIITRLFFLSLLFFCSSSSTLFAGSLQDASDALERKDYNTAHTLTSLLAKQGVAEAQYNLGLMYQDGLGVNQDYETAVKWFQLSAEQGYPSAQFNLGKMYEKGYGVRQDYEKAVKWYKPSAEAGVIGAIYNLGVLYKKRHDYEKATPLLLKAAKNKYVPALTLLAENNFHKWILLAAQKENINAYMILGARYYLGFEDTQDYTEAAKWYRKAAEQGDVDAQNIIGAMYEKGKGISKDFVEAYRWFRVAEESGNQSARMYREKIEQKMIPRQITKAQKLASN